MTSLKKSAYNKSYYEKNKELILKKKKAKKENPSQLSLINFENHRDKPIFKKAKKRSLKEIKIILEFIFSLILVSSMTYFLVKESVAFYLTTDTQNVNPWLKAILIESLLIILMIVKSKSLITNIFTKSLSVLILIYATWSFSSHIFNKKLSGIETSTLIF